MKMHLAGIAGLLAAAGLSLAYAQAPAHDLAAEPVASVSRPDDTANAIAQALSADPELKGSKITVQPDENGTVLLTGVTRTWAQMRKAVSVATGRVGEGKVANAITTEEVFIDVANRAPDAPAEELPPAEEVPSAEGAEPAGEAAPQPQA